MTIDEALQRALFLEKERKLAEAEKLFRDVLRIAPDHPAALLGLAGIAHDTGHFEPASKLAARAASFDPSAAAFTALGSSLRALRKLTEALAAFEKAASLAPSFAPALSNVAVLAWELKRYEQARGAYQRALQLDPRFAYAWHGLMTVEGDLGNFEAAADAGRRAAELGLNTANFWSDFAIALHDIGDLPGTIAAIESSTRLEPNNATARFNLAQLLLQTGDFARGWKEYEWRWGALNFPSVKRNFPQPLWDGSNLAGKTLLLHAEQGFGDAIMWARYIPLAACGTAAPGCDARIIVECQRELLPLLKTVTGASGLIARGDALPPFDVHAPFGTLPLIFQTRLETIPNHVPYLAADPMRAKHWATRIGDDPRRRIGLAWAGAATHVNDLNRSIAFNQLAKLTELPDVRFFSLQKGPRSADAKSASWLTDWTGDLLDFADTAALVHNLDLVISVDTSVIHLAGALAKPVWVLLPFAPDWRWLASRPDDSPWYPTMRLFRQKRPRDWDEVIQRVAGELKNLLNRSSPPLDEG